MPERGRHPKKDVEKALQYTESKGCEVSEIHHGHVWGEVRASSGQVFKVWSTPKNPGNHAKAIRRFADKEES